MRRNTAWLTRVWVLLRRRYENDTIRGSVGAVWWILPAPSRRIRRPDWASEGQWSGNTASGSSLVDALPSAMTKTKASRSPNPLEYRQTNQDGVKVYYGDATPIPVSQTEPLK